MSDYNGWKNRSTWNVSLWINNDENLYFSAVEYMKNYKGKRPYIDFIRYSGLKDERTLDGILWNSRLLDYDALNEMMKELAG